MRTSKEQKSDVQIMKNRIIIDSVHEDWLDQPYFIGIPEEHPQCDCGSVKITRTDCGDHYHYGCNHCPSYWQEPKNISDEGVDIL